VRAVSPKELRRQQAKEADTTCTIQYNRIDSSQTVEVPQSYLTTGGPSSVITAIARYPHAYGMVSRYLAKKRGSCSVLLAGSAVASLLFSHQQPLFDRWPVLGFAEVAGHGIAIERRGGENMAHI